MRRDSAPRHGMVLLEVLVALTLLGVVGASVAAMAVGAGDAVHRAQRNDTELRKASAFLDAVALWTREDLDRRLGSHGQGAWRLDIQRPEPSLYLVVLADSTGTRELLHTALFRPIPATSGQTGDAH